MPPRELSIVAISDTHNRIDAGFEVPAADVLIHAGDFSGSGRLPELDEFAAFIRAQPHPHKIVVAGNHDWCFQRQPEVARARLAGICTYLEDDGVTIEGVRFWGSPWQPEFHDWAFNLTRGAELRAKWDLIPEGIDVLITHGPPLGHGDMTFRGVAVGCEELLAVVERLRPRYHIFGHIHEAYGITRNDHTTFINASTCDFGYQAVNAPCTFTVPVPAGEANA